MADGSETEYTYAKVGNQNGNSPKDMIQKSEGEEFIYHRTYNNLGMLKSAWQSGGEGAHQPYSYTYNLWGGLQSVTDPKGQATTYGYDTLGNATTITKTDETLTYKYNQFGKVDLAQRVRNGQTETADYEYSNLGYLTKKTENGKVLTYTYDLYGKVLSMTDQLGMTTAYEYNDKNQITKVTAEGKEFTYSYYPNGLVQSLTYPASKNGTKVATNYTYDNANRLTNVSTPALNESYSYSYDENSNINGVNNNVEFFYDEVNRIAMSNFKSVGNTQNLYSYDGRGNIKNHVSNKTLPSPKPYTYTYDASNRVKEVTNGSTAVASYDYDLDGIRNKKTVNGTTTEYYTANGNVLAEKTGSSERHNVWTDRILARKDGTTWYYLIYDGLNDVRKVITDSASIVANYTYDEWGNILEKSGSYANQNPIRYKGEYFDDETGFIYLRARYYDPTIDRFITEDPILDGENWYVYCGANPIMYVDPLGLAGQYVPLRSTIENLGGHVYWENNKAIVHIDGAIATFYQSDGNGTFIQNDKMYVFSEYLFSLLGITIDLGKGWTARIERDGSGGNYGRKHVHVYKGNQSYAQNDDGSPHDGSTGAPPNSAIKSLKDKKGWDWKAKEDDWANKISINGTEGGLIYVAYPNGRKVTIRTSYLEIYYPTRNDLRCYYTGPTTIDLRSGGGNIYIPAPNPMPIPVPGPIPIPAF